MVSAIGMWHRHRIGIGIGISIGIGIGIGHIGHWALVIVSIMALGTELFGNFDIASASASESALILVFGICSDCIGLRLCLAPSLLSGTLRSMFVFLCFVYFMFDKLPMFTAAAL
ncbi:hypothetical protein Tco_0455560 [Tanacetum coccineum]